MNKDTIQNIVSGIIGLITLAISSAVGFLFTSIGDLNHAMDLHVSEANKRLEHLEKSDGKTWEFYDAGQEKEGHQNERITRLETIHELNCE